LLVFKECCSLTFRCTDMQLVGEDSSADLLPEVHVIKKSVVAKVAVASGVIGLAALAFLGGERHALRGLQVGSGVGLVLSTLSDFESDFNEYASGLKCQKLTDAVDFIHGTTYAPLPTGRDVLALKNWFADADINTQADKTHATRVMQSALTTTCAAAPVPVVPAAKSAPAPASSHSYSEFGVLYSLETAGKPWTAISEVDTMVRGVQLPVGCSETVRKLNLWYRHLSEDDRKDFDHNAVAHMLQSAR
jgi:hypothetical protein